MIERYQVSGIRVDNGERVTGYYCHRDWDTSNKMVETDAHFISPDGFEIIEVDHDSIEPVKVKPIQGQTGVGDYRCPNCNACFVGITDGYIMNYNPHFKKWDKLEYPGLHGTTQFCGNCGIALDWQPPAQPANRGDNNG